MQAKISSKMRIRSGQSSVFANPARDNIYAPAPETAETFARINLKKAVFLVK